MEAQNLKFKSYHTTQNLALIVVVVIGVIFLVDEWNATHMLIVLLKKYLTKSSSKSCGQDRNMWSR